MCYTSRGYPSNQDAKKYVSSSHVYALYPKIDFQYFILFVHYVSQYYCNVQKIATKTYYYFNLKMAPEQQDTKLYNWSQLYDLTYYFTFYDRNKICCSFLNFFDAMGVYLMNLWTSSTQTHTYKLAQIMGCNQKYYTICYLLLIFAGLC